MPTPQTPRRALRFAVEAEQSQQVADALKALADVIGTDERFAVLRGSFTEETLRRDVVDYEVDADDRREKALEHGFDPERDLEVIG